MIRIISSDNKQLIAERKWLYPSKLFVELLQLNTESTDAETTDKNIAVTNGSKQELNNIVDKETSCKDIKSDTMAYILAFLKEYSANKMKTLPTPIIEPLEFYVGSFYANFIDVDLSMLKDLILAADILDIPPLFDLTCAKYAKMCDGRTPEEIRDMFCIIDDLSNSDKEKIIEETIWKE